MKNISIIIVSFMLFAGGLFAAPYQVKQNAKATTTKKPVKKTDKKEVKKVPHKKTVINKPVTKNTAQ